MALPLERPSRAAPWRRIRNGAGSLAFLRWSGVVPQHSGWEAIGPETGLSPGGLGLGYDPRDRDAPRGRSALRWRCCRGRFRPGRQPPGGQQVNQCPTPDTTGRGVARNFGAILGVVLVVTFLISVAIASK